MTRLREEVKKALSCKRVSWALTRFADNYVVAREKAYAGKDFAVLRQRVAQIKEETIARLEELAEQFVREATRRGAVVYRAASAEEARAYIADLARAKGIKTVVKSKSMATEEIHLNRFLQEQGLEVVETDLGEWIIQLSGQRPSHLVMPAIHMSRQEVAELFRRQIGVEVEPEISQMVQLARRELRKKFLSAWMGISGANVAVAETGTVAILTNEGNGRLTTTLPPVHVVVVGLEKLVPRLADIVPILEVLPRNATAQILTSYVTLITGSVPAVDPEGNYLPQKELHIILLDNGRTRMAADPVFREALKCIRCAACLNVCPVYQQLGGTFGAVYTGGIGVILTAFFTGFEEAAQLQELCLGCQRCREYCSANIDLPGLIEELRRRVVAKKGVGPAARVALAGILPRRRLFHGFLKTAARMQAPWVKEGKLCRLPFFPELTEGRALPPLSSVPFRERTAHLPRPQSPRGKVVFFSGCLIDYVFPGIGEAVGRVLAAMGRELVHPEGQGCCGFPAWQAGLPGTFARLAQQNLAALAEIEAEAVITACPTCTVALKYLYPEVLKGDAEWAELTRVLAEKVTDFSSFVWERREELLPFLAPIREKITYHDSCHLKYTLRASCFPRELLLAGGAELKEMEPAELCCGFGGSFTLKFPELSRAILERKLQAIEGSGAETVALDCPGCLWQIGSVFSGKTKHTAEILAASLKYPQAP
ncbi:protein of unknown function DUF162 [Ammonifex degensii KC4]|uniref:4Fe-4S ferredoxin-type domain-containing protein n=1 Tax=Ammonifex degensii (strain DSM 10501 / KC4) TaxID=429009 RepID=C9RBT7_AMMDK|nr:protein of unknown function DUF162 [Ammonifex degensii KC4]